MSRIKKERNKKENHIKELDRYRYGTVFTLKWENKERSNCKFVNYWPWKVKTGVLNHWLGVEKQCGGSILIYRIQAFSWIRLRVQSSVFDDVIIEEEKKISRGKISSFLYNNFYTFNHPPPELQKTHPALHFFLLLKVIFASLGPDRPSWIRIQS